MPTIQRFATCVIRAYAGDHNPPHVHVVANDGRECLVAIETLEVIGGRLPKREIADAMVWVRQNQRGLIAQWNELNP